MHDEIFENQEALEPADLVSYAKAVGLEPAEFQRESKSRELLERVREDFMSGVRSGVNGTPTFFIGGVRYDGSWDFESLVAALEEAMGE